ncbi:hypothetical protein ACQPZP_33235 [Spirillospora sp. CA-142024]|uniref:hypothetical protein n=1 Tax=Spirillospora sp. CA-142024 TaxID=3240036 RepID=UPI003D8C9510
MLAEASWLLQLIDGGRVLRRRRGPAPPAEAIISRSEQRELAGKMRALPGLHAGRLPARTLERISMLAGAGQWEKAVDQLITSLSSHRETLSSTEHDDLHALAKTLGLPTGRLDALPVRLSEVPTAVPPAPTTPVGEGPSLLPFKSRCGNCSGRWCLLFRRRRRARGFSAGTGRCRRRSGGCCASTTPPESDRRP